MRSSGGGQLTDDVVRDVHRRRLRVLSNDDTPTQSSQLQSLSEYEGTYMVFVSTDDVGVRCKVKLVKGEEMQRGEDNKVK